MKPKAEFSKSFVRWNSSHDMPANTKAIFNASGGWDCDQDWVYMVHPGKAKPPEVSEYEKKGKIVHEFKSNIGRFFVYYHS